MAELDAESKVNDTTGRTVPEPGEAFRQFLENAFVLPFRDPSRAYMYFVSFFFALGFAFIDVFLTIDVAALGPVPLTHYLLAKFGGTCLLIVAALALMGRVGDRLFYSILLGTTCAGFAYIVWKGGAITPFEAGFFYGLFIAPFWAIYHIMFAAATSDSNIGNEVSLAGTGMTVGITFGSITGGLFSQLGLQSVGTIGGFAMVAGATGVLIYRAITTDFIGTLKKTDAMNESILDAIRRCKYRSLGSLLEGVFNIIGGNLWIAFMKLSGIAAAAVGAWQAVMVVAKIIMTPFAGALVNHGKRREMMLGAGLNLLGWTPFLFGAQSFFVLLAMNVWAVGSHLFSTGLSSAWYGSRTIAAIMTRELIMGVSRIATILLATPLVYAAPDSFIKLAVVACAVTVVYSALWMRSVRMKGTVLPIENIVTGN